MRLTDRIAALPPAIVTLIFIVLFVGGGVASLTLASTFLSWAMIYSITMLITLAPILAWHYSIYRAASDRSAAFVGHKGRRAFLFVLCAVSLTTFLVTFPLWVETPYTAPHGQTLMNISNTSMMIGCLSYVLAIWSAANALTRFDDQQREPDFRNRIGTFLLEFYIPIGVWFIHRRIRKVTETPLPA